MTHGQDAECGECVQPRVEGEVEEEKVSHATESEDKGGQGGDGEEEGVQPRAKRKSDEVEGEKEEGESIKTARPECCKDCRITFKTARSRCSLYIEMKCFIS